MICAHCFFVSRVFPDLLLTRNAAVTKNGSEKIMRNVSRVSASMRVSANAFLTMIAFVEKSTAPVNVIRNPAKDNFFNPLKFAAADRRPHQKIKK